MKELVDEALQGSSTGSLYLTARRAPGLEEEQRQANIVKKFLSTHDGTLYVDSSGEVAEDDVVCLLQDFLNYVYDLEEAIAKQQEFQRTFKIKE